MEPVFDQVHSKGNDGTQIERGSDQLSDFSRDGQIFISSADNIFRSFAFRDITGHPEHVVFIQFRQVCQKPVSLGPYWELIFDLISFVGLLSSGDRLFEMASGLRIYNFSHSLAEQFLWRAN